MRLMIVLSVLACAGVVLGKYESLPGVTNTYNLHTERVTWDTAKDVCQLEGGHLIVINSNSEATITNLLFGRIPPFSPPMPWNYDLLHVGITDKAKEGVWSTVLGGLLTDAGFNVWRMGEPNNYGNSEHCGAISRVGTYSDLRCSYATHLCPFICEKEVIVPDAVPDAVPDTTADPVADSVTIAYVDYDVDTKQKL